MDSETFWCLGNTTLPMVPKLLIFCVTMGLKYLDHTKTVMVFMHGWVTLWEFSTPCVVEGYMFKGYILPRHELKNLNDNLILLINLFLL